MKMLLRKELSFVCDILYNLKLYIASIFEVFILYISVCVDSIIYFLYNSLTIIINFLLIIFY